MSELLYNKYRSQRFDEVLGQEAVTDALKGLITTGNYKDLNSIIFSCNKAGSAKTTLARIFAKAANCLNPQDGEPCNECKHCNMFNNKTYPDFLEIDGASYNKVEDMKRIIEVANMYPQISGGTRFIIVDECHRLSNAAWDVMLKLLEEGKNQTVFLFATTEIYNVRPAIISRSFHFSLQPLKWNSIFKILQVMCKKENIKYDSDILKQIAIENEGKTRDAIKVLDMQYKCFGEVTKYQGNKPEDLMTECLIQAFTGNIETARENADLLLKHSTQINELLCRTLFSIKYASSSEYVTQELAERAKDIILDLIDTIISDSLEYKPETVEQFKLFLTVVAGKGLRNVNVETRTVQRKRRVIEQKDDEPTEPTKTEKPKRKLSEIASEMGFEIKS